MKLLLAYSTILFLALLLSLFGNAQQPTISRQDTIIPKAAIGHFKQEIYFLTEKIKLQEFELNVLRETAKVDSFHFDKDSIIVFYHSATGKPLKTITRKFRSPNNNHEDSIVTYFNNNGLIEYKEWWEDGYKRKLPSLEDSVWVKMKLTYRRYEYDDQSRLIRQVVHYPTPRTVEFIYTYDAAGNQIRNSRSINLFHFWGAPESKSSN